MSAKHWILIVLLVISGVVQLVRGLAGTTRTYDEADVVSALIEIPLIGWLAVTG